MVLGGSAGAAAALAAVYGLTLRPWHLRWGATREELRRPMPFDELIPRPNYFATRAISIAAAPEVVWKCVTDRTALPHDTIVRHAEQNRCVVFAPPELEAEATWVVTLDPNEEGTRVVSRNRARFGNRVTALLRYLLVDPGQFLFERQWLTAIRTRAEALQQQMQVAELVP